MNCSLVFHCTLFISLLLPFFNSSSLLSLCSPFSFLSPLILVPLLSTVFHFSPVVYPSLPLILSLPPSILFLPPPFYPSWPSFCPSLLPPPPFCLSLPPPSILPAFLPLFYPSLLPLHFTPPSCPLHFAHFCPPVFQKLRGDQALFQKAVFVLGNLVGVGLALYKVNSMGLLPTAQSDWLEFMEVKDVSAVTQIGRFLLPVYFYS